MDKFKDQDSMLPAATDDKKKAVVVKTGGKTQVIINPPEKVDPQRGYQERFKHALEKHSVIIEKKTELVLQSKAARADIPQETLEQVFKRGYKTLPLNSQLTREQYAMNRVNSFVAGGAAMVEDYDLLPIVERVRVTFGMKGTGGAARPHIKREKSVYNGKMLFHVVDAKGNIKHSTNDEFEAKKHLATKYNSYMESTVSPIKHMAKDLTGQGAPDAKRRAERDQQRMNNRAQSDGREHGPKWNVAEGNMPQSVIKSKQKYADMTAQEFHAAHQNKSEEELKSMAWRHGYGKDSSHYVAKHKKGQSTVTEGLGKDIKRLATGKDVKSRAGQEIAKSQDASMKGDHKTSKKHFDRYDKLDKLANKEQGVAEGFDKLTPQQKAHEYNLDSAQREMDRRHAEGEDMTGAKIDKKTYKIVKPKQQGVAEAKDPSEYDKEGEMAKGQLRTIIANAQRAHDMLKDDTNMAEWVQSKITLASDYISTVADYIQSELKEGKMSGLDIDMQTMKDKDFETHYGKPKREYKPKLKGNQGRLDKNNSGHLDKEDFRLLRQEEVKSMVEVHIASPLSAANANAEYKRQPSNTLKVDVKHLGGVSNHKAIKQHLISKGITAGIGSSDNYNTVHLSNISHSHGEIEKKLGIKEEVKKGLYYYVNRRKKLGISRDKDHPKAPEPQDWKDAAKTAKEEVDLSELSNAVLARYKAKAGEQASAADKAGDFKKGNKRFSGIIKATNKQFDNDAKGNK